MIFFLALNAKFPLAKDTFFYFSGKGEMTRGLTVNSDSIDSVDFSDSLQANSENLSFSLTVFLSFFFLQKSGYSKYSWI